MTRTHLSYILAGILMALGIGTALLQQVTAGSVAFVLVGTAMLVLLTLRSQIQRWRGLPADWGLTPRMLMWAMLPPAYFWHWGSQHMQLAQFQYLAGVLLAGLALALAEHFFPARAEA